MALLMNIGTLIQIAAAAGIPVEDSDPHEANLYVWTDPDGNDLYVGKAASKARHDEEIRFRKGDYANTILSGITTLLRENDAVVRYLRYRTESFDPAPLLEVIGRRQWTGLGFDPLVARLESQGLFGNPTYPEIERVLTRLHIRTGCLIGNSLDASQWENPIGSYADNIAALAIDIARFRPILPAARYLQDEIAQEAT